MKIRVTGVAFVVIMAVPFLTLYAQNPVSPDRPGLGDGSYVLAPKVTYLETGFEYFDSRVADRFNVGQVLFRHGLTEGAELRVLLNSFIFETGTADNRTGVPDPGVGLKVKLFDRPLSPFRLSAQGSVSIPAGSPAYTNEEWTPSISLLADYSLSERVSAGINLDYTSGPGSLDEIWGFTLTPAWSFGEDTGWGGYLGYAGFFTDGSDQHFVEGGFTKHVFPSLQLDFNSGVDAASGELFVGAGLALRF